MPCWDSQRCNKSSKRLLRTEACAVPSREFVVSEPSSLIAACVDTNSEFVRRVFALISSLKPIKDLKNMTFMYVV